MKSYIIQLTALNINKKRLNDFLTYMNKMGIAILNAD